jgi:hypothetical protein
MRSPIVAAAVVISMSCDRPPEFRNQPRSPAIQCYAIKPDTGSRSRLLPEHIVLGANPSGRPGLRVAAVLPDRVRVGSSQHALIAEWRPYGRVYLDDSIYVEWGFLGSIYGPSGALFAEVRGDSISGYAEPRSDAMPAVVPRLSFHGRSESCPLSKLR